MVDDQMFNIDALLIILRYNIGLDTSKYCETSLSGTKAVEMVKADPERYNLILMDCNMPEMDGNEATQLIREFLYTRGYKQPIISAITGHTEQIYINHAIKCGMNQVLSKPVNPLCLRDVVSRCGYPIKDPRG